jgi:hypothetical protein
MAEPVEQDNMLIEWDVEIVMDDGVALRADVFRPKAEGKWPVLLTYGPYAKGLAFQKGYPSAWQSMIANHPDVAHGSTNKYQNWEVVDPEKWVPNGYVCVRVDSRGTGRSPGHVDHFSPRETRDFYECIEWAGVQAWSNGNVGLNGISYYAINQWQVASLQPPHLKAMCIWEGAADWYRDMTHHGGILSTFWANWYDMQVKTVQFGLGERGPRSIVTGALVCGDETMSDDELARNRSSFGDTFSLIRSTTITIKRVRQTGTKLRCRFCRRQTGVVRDCTREEILKAIFGLRQRRSGWSATAWSTGRIFTPITGVNCRKDSSISTSKTKRTIGLNSLKFNCRSATSIVSSSGMKPTGRWPLRFGPGFTLTPGITPFPCSRPPRTRRSALQRWATE